MQKIELLTDLGKLSSLSLKERIDKERIDKVRKKTNFDNSDNFIMILTFST